MSQPSEFSSIDAQMMARALRLAEQGGVLARPNPRVGCVLWRDGQIVGEGFHQCFGEAHAEVNALAQAGERARGATAYVTLEPCAHTGKTGPCAKALIEAGVAKVVCAMRDPNPKVDGGGFNLLEQAGIEVSYGLMESEAVSLNRGFIMRMTQGRPLVRLKMAISVDGRTAMASGESQWITGSAARADVQLWRARSDAIITGTGTLALDNPSLNVRLDELAKPLSDTDLNRFRQPLRILIDRRARANLKQGFFQITSPIWWVGETEVQQRLAEHIERKLIPGAGEAFLNQLLKLCAAHECNEVLVEAGSVLAGEFLRAGLVDELVVYMASKLMGSDGRPLAILPLSSMEQAVNLTLSDCRMVGNDLRLIYHPIV